MASVWSLDTDVNIAEFNLHHQQIFSLFYDLEQAIISNKCGEKIGALISERETYTDYHFGAEEKYLKLYDFPETDEHIAEHRDFARMISVLADSYPENELRTSLFLLKYLEQYIKNHVTGTDKRYSKHLNDRGLY
jgi:hemerythrin-like metal-binding protein